MVRTTNPFSLIKAADYTDEQINSLWVDAGTATINQVIEPKSRLSKLILGGKGTGKTHLLRYHSYQAMRLRNPHESPLTLIQKEGFLGVFVRANSIDAARFSTTEKISTGWREAFALYFELRLVEALMDAMRDITKNAASQFNDNIFLKKARANINHAETSNWKTIADFSTWVEEVRRQIDHAVNNAVFVGRLEVEVPFTLGTICLEIGGWIREACPNFGDFALIYLVDELENWSEDQQRILNSLIRYSEGKATFRVGARLYGIKTSETMGGEEPIRDKAEFLNVYLDEILRNNKKFTDFAKRLFCRRLEISDAANPESAHHSKQPAPTQMLAEVMQDQYLTGTKATADQLHVKRFIEELIRSGLNGAEASLIADKLTHGFAPIFQKLNIVIFYKKWSVGTSSVELASRISGDASEYVKNKRIGSYQTAYGHYKSDLFAQLCREYKKQIPYAGFDTFVRMSLGNPKNLLILLGEAYGLASFYGETISPENPLSVVRQTEAAKDASRFVFEQDEHYGTTLDDVRHAVERLGELLKTARFAQNPPEVSPLVVTYDDALLSSRAQATVKFALNWSFLFEIKSGRPARNSKAVHKKLLINPMMSARWALPIAKRGDLNLNADLVNAIFDSEQSGHFKEILKILEAKWDHPLSIRRGRNRTSSVDQQILL